MTNQPSTNEGPAEGAPAGARQQVSAYAQGSVANMLRSALVIAAIMALMIIMYPRLQPDHTGVDAMETAQQLADSSGLPVSAPQDLPEGWIATRAEYRRGADSLMTWHALYETPDGNAVALNQTQNATDVWVKQTVNQTEQIGEQDIAGVTWDQYAREGNRPQRSFVDRHEGEDLTTVVTGDAPWSEIELFVEALTPAGANS